MLGLDSQNRIGLGFDGNCTTHLEQGLPEENLGLGREGKGSTFWVLDGRSIYGQSRIMGSV